MSLEKLFKVQKELDKHVEEKHPRKNGEDRLAKKILALQVELGECANEWRGFKFWKKNREPRTAIEVFCGECQGTGTPIGIPEESGVDCWKCEGAGSYFKNPLLEEYVDCLHFILSIGNDMEFNLQTIKIYKKTDITEQFISVFDDVSYFQRSVFENWEDWAQLEAYEEIFSGFVGLGEMLGFTWEQIEQAYLDKNEVNHKRQNNGY